MITCRSRGGRPASAIRWPKLRLRSWALAGFPAAFTFTLASLPIALIIRPTCLAESRCLPRRGDGLNIQPRRSGIASSNAANAGVVGTSCALRFFCSFAGMLSRTRPLFILRGTMAPSASQCSAKASERRKPLSQRPRSNCRQDSTAVASGACPSLASAFGTACTIRSNSSAQSGRPFIGSSVSSRSNSTVPPGD